MHNYLLLVAKYILKTHIFMFNLILKHLACLYIMPLLLHAIFF